MQVAPAMPIQLQTIVVERTVVASLAALAACGVTACVLKGYTPHQLYAKGQRWLARRQVPSASEEPDGEPWPAAGQPGPPQCRPLSTIAELLTWQAPTAAEPSTDTLSSLAAIASQPQGQPLLQTQQQEQAHRQQHVAAPGQQQNQQLAVQQGPQCPTDPCCSEVPLQLSARHSSNRTGHVVKQQPQLLVCHDMMGGYLPQDALLSGSSDHRHYRMWHWDCIDVFVYFSHHMVTIPPKGWIHAAHRHGVKVLGTFITEFGQGHHRCNKLFNSNDSAEQVADQLVAVAVHYGFEGWLVNIENSLSKEQVEVMQHFVGYLRARMAAVNQHSMVVWYDAVTTAGELRWQNQLSPLNASFFDLADALFVNYTWKPETLADTITASAARHTDVFMGIDVHGRGSYGGGGHNVGVALRAAADAGLSAALFAPGWLYENLDRTKFVELQEQWWSKVQQIWGYSHPVIHSLPFVTVFNAGAGRGWFRGGQLLAEGAAAAAASLSGLTQQQQQQDTAADGAVGSGWFNMVVTDTLPTCRDPITQQVVSAPIVGRLTSSTAFDGGSCLVICSSQQAAAGSASGVVVQSAAASVVDTAAGRSPLPPSPAAAVAAAADTLCHSQARQGAAGCWLRSAASDTATGGRGSTSSQHNMAMLQLYGAQILVPHFLQLTVSWVYAARGSEGNNQLQQQAQQQDQQLGAAPLLWLMTQQASATAAAAASQQQAIHLLGPSAKSDKQQVLQLANGQEAGVAVHVAAVLEQQRSEVSLGPLQFVSMDDGNDSSHDKSPNADSMWNNDISDALGGCQWRHRTLQLTLKAGNVVRGIGVAVSLGHALGTAAKSGVSVHAVLGQIEIMVA